MKSSNARSQRRKEIQIFDRSLIAFLRYILLVLLLFRFSSFYSQESPALQINKAKEIINDRGEVVLQFKKPSDISLTQLTQIISIDNFKNDTVRAYVNLKQLGVFLKLYIDFEVIEPPVLQQALKSTGSVWDWNKYPAYSEYLAMMDSFSHAYPSLCKIINAGSSIKGHSILFARISSDTTKIKPKVMYSSAIHGNELAGYVLMLRFIDYLIKNYNVTSTVTRLVDSLEIWINPLANPDGAYKGGDNTVFKPSRLNADSVDLNRNYPDPVQGDHPDGYSYQPETNAMMNLMSKYHFVLSVNFHSGSEVVNYPWDSKADLHPDDAWFRFLSKEYADTVQKFGRSGYFTDVTSSGIINGYEWYPVYGGRQDYITYFHDGREVTIEIDKTKMTPESELKNLWNYNYRSFIHYLEHAIYGIGNFKRSDLEQGPSKIENRLIVYPNPCNQFFQISCPGVELIKIDIEIFDLSGKTIKRITEISSTEPVQINNLHSGIYFLNIRTKSNFFRGKIIIER